MCSAWKSPAPFLFQAGCGALRRAGTPPPLQPLLSDAEARAEAASTADAAAAAVLMRTDRAIRRTYRQRWAAPFDGSL